MEISDERRKVLVDNFRRLYLGTQGGIFTQKTRERIMTNEGLSGRGITRNQFWYRQRENVKTALIDLQLFVELADKENVDKVMTREALEPIVTGLLWGRSLSQLIVDKNSAEIAYMFIRWGLEHLRAKAGKGITLSHERTINEALDLAEFLLRTIRES